MKAGSLVSKGLIEEKILLIRGQRVLLDVDLAKLYGVTTKNLNKAVKRNQARFPSDFMFRLTQEEHHAVRFQFGTLKRGQHAKYAPAAFTEQGVAMLSGVLRSPRAVRVNVEIMRTFVRLRQFLSGNKELSLKLSALEKRHDGQFRMVFEAIRQLQEKAKSHEVWPEPPKRRIGFRVDEQEAVYGRNGHGKRK